MRPLRPARGPVFLARRAYRIRRLRDAARLLPVAGGFLFLLPLMWSPVAGGTRSTAMDGVYFFVVWAVLIVIAAALSRGLARGDDAEPAGARDLHDDPDASAPEHDG